MQGKSTELQDVNSNNAPRYYSVSNSPLMQPKTVQVCFAVVDYLTTQLDEDSPTASQQRIGGAITTYLETMVAPLLAEGKECEATVSNFPKPTDDFHLLEDVCQPMILVGPGVAPFCGFLSHCAAQCTQYCDQPLGPMEFSLVATPPAMNYSSPN